MTEAPSPFPLLNTRDDVILEIATNHLKPEDVAALMATSKKACEIFGDEKIWEELAEHFHIPVPLDQPAEHRFMRSVVNYYHKINQAALLILDPRHDGPGRLIPENPGVFEQRKAILKHLDSFSDEDLKHTILEEIFRSQAALGAIDLLMKCDDRTASATKAIFADLVAANTRALAQFPNIPRDPNVFSQRTHINVYLERLADYELKRYITQEINQALLAKQPGAIKFLLTVGGNVGDWARIHAENLLIIRAQVGDEARVRILVDLDIPLYRNCYGVAALNEAVLHDHADIVEILLHHGASANEISYDGRSILMLAVGSDSVAAVRTLLDHGALINEKDAWGNTALMMAEKPEIIQMMVAHGADVNEKNDRGRTPLMRAVTMRLRNAPLVDLLRTLIALGASINEKDASGETALMVAAEWGCTIALRTLLAHGAEANAKDGNGLTALDYATEYFPGENAENVALLERAMRAQVSDE